MRKLSLILLLAVGLQPALFADIADARVRFERTYSALFRRAVLQESEVADKANCYDRAQGKAKFVFAMPYADDRRLNFVTAEFDGGRFVSGQLHVLGFEPKALDAMAFEKLRETRPMVSVCADRSDFVSQAVLYPVRGQRSDFVANDDRTLTVDPVPMRLGALVGALGRLGVETDQLAYRVTMTGRDGQTIDLGVTSKKSPLTEKAVLAKIRRAIEGRHPERKGQVSDRDAVDYRHGSTIHVAPSRPVDKTRRTDK